MIVVDEIVEAALRITIDEPALLLPLKLEPEIFTPEPASTAIAEVVIVTLEILTTDELFV